MRSKGKSTYTCFSSGFMQLPLERTCAPKAMPALQWEVEVKAYVLLDGMVVAIEKVQHIFGPMGVAVYEADTCEEIASAALMQIRALRKDLVYISVKLKPVGASAARGVMAEWSI